MKKLMIATAAAALAGSAFALPQVYDFKATSVKYLYLQDVKVKAYDKVTYRVYKKVQKTTSLKGYLIQDTDGATSQALYTGLYREAGNTSATAFDYGRNRAFLVVMNGGTLEKGFKQPKILPAVLDAKFIDTSFNKPHSASSGLAEGTLYVGGDAIPCSRPQLDFLKPLTTAGAVNSVASRAGDLVQQDEAQTSDYEPGSVLNAQPPAVPERIEAGEAGRSGSVPGMVALSDYVWTSVYLFGKYNGPNWFGKKIKLNPYSEFETLWNLTLPYDLARYEDPYAQYDELHRWTYVQEDGETFSFAPFYHDTWMNGAGFGKYIVPGKQSFGDVCCGDDDQVSLAFRATLDSLSGSLKGGLFLCTDNGVNAADTENYMFFDNFDYGRDGWDAQFYSSRVVPALVGTQFEAPGDVYPFFNVDKWTFDLWQDGPFEQETTDVISGSWSIKANLKFHAKKGLYEKYDLTNAEIGYLAQFNPAFDPETADYVAANYGEHELVRTIKAAVKGLQASATFIDGREIYDINRLKQTGELPVLTPQFAKYYGLANWR